MSKETTVVIENEGFPVSFHLSNKAGMTNGTVLLLPGAMSTSETMKDLAEELCKETFQVARVDYTGHGESGGDALTDINAVSEVVANAVYLMQQDGHIDDNIIIVGHSMGGSIGLLLSIALTDSTGLVLVNSAPEFKSLSFLEGLKLEDAQENVHNALLGNIKHAKSEEDHLELLSKIKKMVASAEACVADVKAVLDFDLIFDLPKVKVPTLIVYGEEDPVATEDNQQLMLDKIPNSEIVRIAGAPHYSQVTHTKEVAEAIVGKFTQI